MRDPADRLFGNPMLTALFCGSVVFATTLLIGCCLRALADPTKALSSIMLVSAPAMPDPTLTPGAVVTTDPAVICAPGYARAHRTWRGRQSTMREYDIAPSEWRDYTDDDRVPVCLGGDNASPKNHWAQPFDEALVKDRLEDEMCREVCAGEISLPAAQAIFLGDWRSRLAP